MSNQSTSNLSTQASRFSPTAIFRRDIQWTERKRDQRWVARDPLTSRFYYFSEIEHVATQMLDGKRPISSVLIDLQRIYPSVPLSLEWLRAFISRLSASHLILPSSRDQAQRLVRMQRKALKSTFLQFIVSPLSIRIPLFDPHPFLELLRPLALALFARVTVFVAVVVGIVANLCVAAKLLLSPTSLVGDLSQIQGDQWLMLLVSYVVVKSLHELGHGLACVRWKVRCNELGLLFLFFTPCVYCDTTDAWRLASRAQRAAISAAGMYVELILATFAAIVWLLTRDGNAHTIAANVMIICSIGTLLVNGNPLMKYDGYYILSDLCSVPNLSEQSRDAALRVFTQFITGQKSALSHLDGNVWALAFYACLSVVYRILVFLTILWLLWSMLVPMGLGLFAVTIMLGMSLGLVISWIRTFRSIRMAIIFSPTLKYGRTALLLGLAGYGIAFIANSPVPTFVRARGVTDFQDKIPLFAPETSTLVRAGLIGRNLEKGELLLEFDSPEKRMELTKIQGEIQLLMLRTDQLKRFASFDPAAAYELAPCLESLADRESKERLLNRALLQFVQRAPKSGCIIPNLATLGAPLASSGEDRVHLSPLAPCNTGCLIQRGTLLGWFSSQADIEVVAIVSEQDIKRLSIGQPADCQWDCDVDNVIRGTISRIAPDPILESPDELVGDPGLHSERNEMGRHQPIEPHYSVSIIFSKPTPLQTKGSLVTVQFPVSSETLWQMLVHSIRLSLRPL